MATINFKNNDTNETYDLMDRQPSAPYATVENSVKFFIKLVTTQDGQQKVQLNDMFIHVEVENDTRFLYFSDKDRILRKISILDGREIWNYPIGVDIKSICIDSNYNCYVTTNSDIRKISDGGKYVSTLNIQSDKTINDGEDLYITKGTKLSKVTQQGQEQFSYNLDANIKNIATDKVGDIYVATDKDVRKLAKKIIGDKDSKNLLMNSGFENNNLIDFGCVNDCTKSIVSNIKYQGEYSLRAYYSNVKNYDSGLSISYSKAIANQSYTLSGYANPSRDVSIRIRPLQGEWTTLGDKIVHLKANQWNYFTHTFITKDTRNQTLILLGNDENLKECEGMNLYLDNIQLEEGTQATPWTPNSQDYVNIGEWKYSINPTSIAIDSENNLYISTNSNIEKLNTQGTKIDTLDIQADNIALDSEDNLYISKDKSVEKLAKKIIGDKDSRNLLSINQNTQRIEKVGDKYGCKFKTNDIGSPWKGWTNLHLQKNTTYTVSFNAYANNGTQKMQCDLFPDMLPEHNFIFDTENKRYSFTFSSDKNEIGNCYLRFFTYETKYSTDVTITDVQLEIGDKATPYKPNIADYIREGEWKHIDNSEINNIAIG